MGTTVDAIDSGFRYGEKSFATDRAIQSAFCAAAFRVARHHECTDGSFKFAALQVSEYIILLKRLAQAELEIPIPSARLPELLAKVKNEPLDDGVKATLLEFLGCCNQFNLDILFSG